MYGKSSLTVKFDTLSKFFFVIALTIPIFIGLFTSSFVTLLPTILLLSGFILYLYSHKEVMETDMLFSQKTITNLYYAFICLAAMLMAGRMTQAFVPQRTLEIAFTPEQAMLYAVHLAVAEEIFFRVGLLAFLFGIINNFFAIIIDAGLFAVYHIARYGLEANVLMYIFGAGLILAYTVYKTQTPSPVIIAHIANNIVLPYLIGGV